MTCVRMCVIIWGQRWTD